MKQLKDIAQKRKLLYNDIFFKLADYIKKKQMKVKRIKK